MLHAGEIKVVPTIQAYEILRKWRASELDGTELFL